MVLFTGGKETCIFTFAFFVPVAYYILIQNDPYLNLDALRRDRIRAFTLGRFKIPIILL